MSRTIGIIIIVALLIVVAGLIFMQSPRIEKMRIETAIELANYCEEDSDCVDAGSKCPFGCYAYVNEAEVERISDMIDAYDSRCVYSCLACPTAVCEDNKCKEVCQE